MIALLRFFRHRRRVRRRLNEIRQLSGQARVARRLSWLRDLREPRKGW